MEHRRSLMIDFDAIEEDKKHDPNLNEQITVKSSIINVKNPMESEITNYKMNRIKALRALQRHTFRNEVSLFLNMVYNGDDYVEWSGSYYTSELTIVRKKGGQSCIVGSRNLQLTLKLLSE